MRIRNGHCFSRTPRGDDLSGAGVGREQERALSANEIGQRPLLERRVSQPDVKYGAEAVATSRTNVGSYRVSGLRRVSV